MSAPDLPEVHWITVRGEEHLAVADQDYKRNLWLALETGAYYHQSEITDHGSVIPAGPVDCLVALPEVAEAVRGKDGHWRVGMSGSLNGEMTRRRAYARVDEALLDVARDLAVARAIDAEKAKPTARERLLERLERHLQGGTIVVPTADLRAALADQP
jgi:hypothetical protein